MTDASSQRAVDGGAGLHDLEAALFTSPENHVLIRHYFDTVVASQQKERAKPVFEKLLERYQNHHQARSLYISLCLQLNAYHDAMAAIETMVAFSTPDDAFLDAALNVREKIGPLGVASETSTGSRLSVCMIAKDEQPLLASCLNSVKKIAAEIVLVDTGSRDRTADIARIFGARVYHIEWRDDFAAARNVALEAARGDWILALDADEMIAEQDHAVLKKMLSDHLGSSTAFRLETRNYTHSANSVEWNANDGRYPLHEAGIGWFPSRKIRLFPNRPELRFQFPVHELVDPSVQSAGYSVGNCPIPIHHYGHLNETKNRKKADNYFRMGYAKLEQLGDDVAAIRELAVQAGQLEMWAESLVLWKRLLQIRPDFIEAFINMSGASWQLARYEEAYDFAQKVLVLQPGSREGQYNLAVSHLMLGRSRKAFEILHELHEKDPDYLAAQFMTAAAAVCMEDFEHGILLFKKMKASVVGATLLFGIKDLIKRLKEGRREGDAKHMEHALTMLLGKTASHG